jgi:hemoglobin
MTVTLLSRFGGVEGLTRIVCLHYDRIAADDHLGAYFMGVDMDRLKAMQVSFLRKAFGDPGASYTGASVQAAHKGQLVSELAFDAFIDSFIEVAAEQGADAATQAEARAALKALRSAVITEFKPNPAYNYPSKAT